MSDPTPAPTPAPPMISTGELQELKAAWDALGAACRREEETAWGDNRTEAVADAEDTRTRWEELVVLRFDALLDAADVGLNSRGVLAVAERRASDAEAEAKRLRGLLGDAADKIDELAEAWPTPNSANEYAATLRSASQPPAAKGTE